MFTGIIENIGIVKNLNKNISGSSIQVHIVDLKYNLSKGDSVAINGVCLTIASIENGDYKFDISPETISITSLSKLTINSSVNIEMPLTLNKFISGHIISGHIDNTESVLLIENKGDAWLMEISISPDLNKYIVKKGSVTIDGVSLTINRINNRSIELMIIPHTYENTIIKYYNVGTQVNIEVDYILKHLEKLKND